MRLTTTEVANILQQVDYMPGWSFDAYEHEWLGTSILIFGVVPDANDPTKTVHLRIHSAIPAPALWSAQQFLAWLHWRLCQVAMHEVSEFLRYSGERVLPPHSDTGTMREVEHFARERLNRDDSTT